jgi:dTDP-4-dehydrorhamnose reductase
VKVLVIGKTGQLALELFNTAPSKVEVQALDRASLDISDSATVSRTIAQNGATVVLNAAAYTAVDSGESDAQSAYAVNDTAVGAMATACSDLKIRFIHVSTDFVFDGATSRPYRTEDAPNPVNVYGASKLAGERRIASTPNLDWRIVRTAWVYSATGKNFLLTMLRLFRERDEVRVVSDQVGTPTSARSLAECVWKAAQDDGPSGIVHFTDAGVASWYDFAVAIYEEARALKLIEKHVRIVPIRTEEYPTPARRPAYSVLDKSETYARFGVTPVHWRVRLREVMQELSK